MVPGLENRLAICFIFFAVPRASQMGVYPGGAFQEEEEDADVKRMKVQ